MYIDPIPMKNVRCRLQIPLNWYDPSNDDSGRKFDDFIAFKKSFRRKEFEKKKVFHDEKNRKRNEMAWIVHKMIRKRAFVFVY